MKHKKIDWKQAYRVVIKKWRRLSESFAQIQARSPETHYSTVKCRVAECEDVAEIHIRGYQWCEPHYENFIFDNPEQADQFKRWQSQERYGKQSGRKKSTDIDPRDLKIDIDILIKAALLKGYRAGSDPFRQYMGQSFMRSGIYKQVVELQNKGK